MGEWKPDRAEAQFIGEVFNIDEGLAKICRGMLARGVPLDTVVATFKDAVKIARLVRQARP